ncbi:MAG: haloacid dehalogenase-like hydrolase [bacterium]|nr:MAG: haloacid dehalogenase-like hydrolase [bacterium]
MKRLHNVTIAAILISTILLAGCGIFRRSSKKEVDYLPSWNEGPAKRAVVDFVTEVTDFFSDAFVPPGDRIAVIDSDGTLWPEKPHSIPAVFIYDRILDLADRHPEWETTEPFRSILRRELDNLSGTRHPPLLEAAHGGMAQEEFAVLAEKWVRTREHPRFASPYRRLAYFPVLELVKYLDRSGFKVFVCTDGDVEFVRAFSEMVFGIPRDRVIGTLTEMQFEVSDLGPVLIRMGTVVPPANEADGKPVNIQRVTGGRPIFTFGNADGDIPMMEFTGSEFLPSRVFFLVHDDAVREYEYYDGSEELVDLARERGWIRVSMAKDFRTVFAPEKNRKKD